MAAPSFWEDNRRAQELIRERAELARTVTGVAELSRQAADLGVLLEWAAESDDADHMRRFNLRFANEPRLLSMIYPGGDGTLAGVVLS